MRITKKRFFRGICVEFRERFLLRGVVLAAVKRAGGIKGAAVPVGQ